jgi:predicted permease
MAENTARLGQPQRFASIERHHFEIMLRMANLQADLRFALRSMRAAPGFTATALLTLVLGMGATTAIFSVVYAVLFRPLPYKDPQRLVNIVANEPADNRSGVPLSLHDTLLDQSGGLEQVAVYYRNTGWSRVIVGGRANPEQVQAGFVSTGLFPVLGVTPLVGRTFEEAEIRRAERVAVISHSFWLTRFGGREDVLGKSIEVDDKPVTIIGVMPREFQFPGADTQLWLPISTSAFWLERPAPDNVHSRGFFMRWNLVARLRPEVTVARVQSELLDLDRRLTEQDRNWNMGLSIKVLPLSIEVGERAKLSLWLLFGAVALVLLIACANVANLLLARGASRTKEMAVRLALGASRGRIAQQILTECLVLVSLASALALILASGLIRLLVSWGPPGLPRLEEARLDAPVMLFSLIAALLTAILFGVAPALNAARNDPQSGLRIGAGRNISAGDSRASAFLVIAEFAIAIVLTTSAGLLLRSLWQAESIDLGYEPQRILTMRLQFPSAFSNSQRLASNDRLKERLQAFPGVESVGGIRNLFELGAPPSNSLRSLEGQPDETNRSRPLTWTTVSGDYFQAMGIPLLAGRLFSDRDREGSDLVAVIDQSMAKRYWAGHDPIGSRFKGQDRRGANDEWITVIGVVRDARRQGVEREPTPHVFLWHRQSEPTNDWVIKSSVRRETLVAGVRQLVGEIEPRTVINSIAPMEALLDSQITERRFQTWLISLFAVLALTLSAVGIFGVMSHAAARRTHEIGIRMALGADRLGVVRLILLRGLGLATIGLLAGVLLAGGATQLLSSLLFGVTPTDPATFGLALAILLAVAALATLIPAWRASGIDPLLALRKD